MNYYPKKEKVTNEIVTPELLSKKTSINFGKQKWILFCEHLLNDGFELKLYEARRTVSKYITIIKDGKEYKVRFSNHKPINARELRGDCDFFVGKVNEGKWHKTEDALLAVYQWADPVWREV